MVNIEGHSPTQATQLLIETRYILSKEDYKKFNNKIKTFHQFNKNSFYSSTL